MMALLSQYYSQNLTSSNTNSSNSTSTVTNLERVTAINSDGDTFQMSGVAASTMLSTAEMYSNMDTDSDGLVSESEFLASRPSDVTAEMAANLYSSIDTDSSGSLTESEFETAMNNALSVNTVSATSSASSAVATQSAGGGGTASASNSCPLGNSTCTGCGQCGKITLSSSSSAFNSSFSSSQNNTNSSTSKTIDYLSAIATKAYESNSIYL
jgi:hypothetical protein